jgi:hypothetical protein
MSVDERRVAPCGKFRVSGYDQYDYSNYFVGDYLTLDEAIQEARSRALVANAIPTSFSDIFFVYDHLGICKYRVTHDEIKSKDADAP